MTLTSIELFADKAIGIGAATPRTVVCLGTPRGGTSMVAGAIVGLGVPMGRDLTANVEDPDFNANRLGKPLTDFVRDLPAVIAARNADHAVWGWKFPRAGSYLGEIAGKLRQPMLVVVMRDPVPAVLRDLNRGSMSAMEAVQQRVRMGTRNVNLVETLQVPALMVSYERAITYPTDFLTELAGFLKCDLPTDLTPILDFMKPGAYKLPPVQTAVAIPSPRNDPSC